MVLSWHCRKGEGKQTSTFRDHILVLQLMKLESMLYSMFAGKNVASEIALKLCDSVQSKLEGKVLGTFSSISSTVKETITDACVQILSPHRRIDILRDAMEAKQQRRPFSMVFCGVNGVGKSTNLAKVSDNCY